MKVQSKSYKFWRFVLYVVLIALAVLMLIPFAWMLSASLKLDKDVFIFPIQWIPENPRWRNYIDIWTKIPLSKFVLNTTKLTIIVTLLQLLTSSFAAYAFAKLDFKGKDLLFLAYIATIAVPWQVYMVPQFMMMRSMGLADTHLAIIFLQAFSAFGVFMMKQFYEGIPTELCEAARIDGMTEYQIWYRIMLPLSKPSLSTLTIFTFVNTWNDFLDGIQEDPAAGTAYVYQPVWFRVRADYGSFRAEPDSGADRILVAAEVFCRRCGSLRSEGVSMRVKGFKRVGKKGNEVFG